MPYDLLLKGGTLVDPAAGLHAPRDVAFADGKVAAVGEDLPRAAEEVVDCAGLLVSPGMIDLHVHVFAGVSHYGIEPDPHCLARGVTTAVDAGSAGADTFPGFRKYVIDVSTTRIVAMLHISSIGMARDDRDPDVGELEDIRWARVDRAIDIARTHAD